jgi:hypothetical protein
MRGIEAKFARVVEFAPPPHGTVADAYPINAAYDGYGFVRSAMCEARRLQADPEVAQGRAFTACVPIDFRVR